MPDTYDLKLIQGERFRRNFKRLLGDVPQSLIGYEFRAQVRQKQSPSSLLLLDLTPYLTLDNDGVTLRLSVPASATASVQDRSFRAETGWDLFLLPNGSPDDAFLLLQGKATLDPANTKLSAS